MIEIENLSKRYGATRRVAHFAVDDVTFRCEPGTVTGFLGPNGRVGFGRIWSGKRRLGFGSAARPEVEEDPDRWAPPVSGWRERARARAAAAWAGLGRARERERKGEMGRNRPKDQEGGTFELF